MPKDWLSLDLRALAYLRVVLALFVLADFGNALLNVGAFYSDQGILPRAAVAIAPSQLPFSVFMGSGSAEVQVIWILFGMVCSLLVLLGTYTRTGIFWAWFILASLHIRNHYAADRGAIMLELMLFWGFFLPLEARASLAARRNPGWAALPNQFRSLGTVAFLVQIALVYIFTTALKNGPEWALEGNAPLIACRSAQVSTPYSEWLAATIPNLLKEANAPVLTFEAVMPLLILCPIAHNRLRLLAVAVSLLFHLHNTLVFKLGYFPLMNAAFSLVMLPGPFWSRIWPGKDPSDPKVPADSLPAGYRLSTMATGWLILCLIYCLFCNVKTCPRPRKTKIPEPIRSFGKAFRLEQSWELFSPSPPNDLWFRMLAVDAEGHEYDLLRPDLKVSLDRPRAPMSQVSHLWQMVLLNTVYFEDRDLRHGVFEYWKNHLHRGLTVTKYQVVTRDFDEQDRPLSPVVRTLWPPEHRVQVTL
ncbi:HTTM domain-containing protein [bacterium]|nr:HTTM domain-containing protein [bacterium]